MRTFRFDGAHTEPVAAARAQVSDRGMGETRRLLAMGKCRQSLPAIAGAAKAASTFDAIIRDARTALDAGAYGAAYDRLTCYPSCPQAPLIEPTEYLEFLTAGWRISKLLPREQKHWPRWTRSAAAPRNSMEPISATGNRISAHDVYGDRDGFVAFANRLRRAGGRQVDIVPGTRRRLPRAD